jgi:hypothetical protein
MCDEESSGIGDLVPDDTIVYRGCSRKNFLTPSKDAVAPQAFQKSGLNHKDGLSLALTMVDSVRPFKKGNFGAVAISVGDIHGLNRGLEVRFDLQTPGHIIVRNMPCMDRPHEMQTANEVSVELAFKATVASATPIVVPAEVADDIVASAEE